MRLAPILALVFVGLSAPAAGQLFRLRNHTFDFDGLTRQYLVYTPAKARALPGKRPLVLVLHGGGGTHRGMTRITKSGFHKLADRDGFYVVYPDAINKSWDFGEGKISMAHKVRVDDRGFFEELLYRLRQDLPIDDNRIFATGISRGGQASYFLACKFPGTFRAVAPVTMPLPGFLEDDCRTSPATGIAIFNGTEDPLVPYEGGQIKLFSKERGAILSTEDTVAFWRERNGCASEGVTTELPDTSEDGARVEKTSWTDCEGAPVLLYKIIGGGHTWPSGGQYLPAALIGRATSDIDGAAEIWSFFRDFE